MHRKLIPPRWIDRIGVAALLAHFAAIAWASTVAGWVSLVLVPGIAWFLYSSYWIQSPPLGSKPGPDYASLIARVDGMKQTIGSIAEFLESEQKRVKATEATVARLLDQQQRLEPIVQAKRETVEAILAAHAGQQLRTIWKERAFSFALGISTSVLASFIFEGMKRQ